MKTVILYASRMTAIDSAHARLAEALSFPEYYGGNLDALYGLLIQSFEPTHIILKGCGEIRKNLGTYGESLLKTLADASVENGCLTVTLEE